MNKFGNMTLVTRMGTTKVSLWIKIKITGHKSMRAYIRGITISCPQKLALWSSQQQMIAIIRQNLTTKHFQLKTMLVRGSMVKEGSKVKLGLEGVTVGIGAKNENPNLCTSQDLSWNISSSGLSKEWAGGELKLNSHFLGGIIPLPFSFWDLVFAELE